MKKKAIAASALTAMALFGASQQAKASAVMVPAVAFGGGWATLVSIVNKQGVNSLHLAYNYKQIGGPASASCLHADGTMSTSANDLTSFIVDGSTDRPVPLYGDTGYGGGPASFAVALAPANIGLPHLGFLAIENSTSATGGDLVAEAIVYNLSQRFLFSQRSIDLNHTSAGSATIPLTSTLTSGTTTTFISFAPGDSNPLIYAIGAHDTTGTQVNVFNTNYNAVIGLSKNNNTLYDRKELPLSDSASLTGTCIVIQSICAPQNTPTTGLVSYNTCYGGTAFKNVGGWFDLINTVASTGTLVLKVESNPSYGSAVTPLHRLDYSR